MSAWKTISESRPSSNRLIGAGLLSAIAASLCCITPVLALIAGSTGMAATFSWLEPARPFLTGITVVILAFAWWNKLKPETKEEIACHCEEDTKRSFWQSKKYLSIVTFFAASMLAFPYYTHLFYPRSQPVAVIAEPGNIQKTEFLINGMTCKGCEEHIEHTVSQIPGLIEAAADHRNGTAMVRFDESKTNIEEIIETINKTGFTVIDFTFRE